MSSWTLKDRDDDVVALGSSELQLNQSGKEFFERTTDVELARIKLRF